MISKNRMAIKFLLVVVLVCVFVSGDDARCIAREREALLRFKNGLIDEFEILSSWRGEECCKWYGVECRNTTRHVIKLQLNNLDSDHGVLQGMVGSSLLELHHLNYLDLSGNDFGGTPIPRFIGSMKQLQHLYLKNSEFSGIVPPHIGNLTNLRSLDLSHNSLKTRNLDWLSTLPLLSFLDLSEIDLSRTNWLPHIQSLHSLDILHLNSCNITDVKPSGGPFVNSSSTSLLSIIDLSYNHFTWSSSDLLSNISTSLVTIYLSDNALSGSIPNVFERFNLLEHLHLASNTLQGEIPKSLVNLSHLRDLVLYENDFRGQFDELFGNLSGKGILESLEILDLARNQLNGSVPDLRAFSALTELYLGRNNFTGSIPLNVGQLSNLYILDLSHNSLEGSVNESLFIKLDKLKILDLSFNSLILNIAPDWSPPFQLACILLAGCNVGPSFPKWIRTQRNVQVLDLSRAGIRDEVPRWLWTTSPILQFLLLSDNQISGTIPSLSSMTYLLKIILTNNSISGPIPSFNAIVTDIVLSENMFTGSISPICELPHSDLRHIDLSNNKLSGELPNCWENTPNLGVLNLADNSFSGQIPPSFGSLHHLYSMQLRGNNLSGEFPSTLRFCQALKLFDVGGNELTGEIPPWIGELYRIYFLNLGRNRFHGSVPIEICNLTDIRILDLSVNNLSGKIPDCFNNFTQMTHKNIPEASFSIFGYDLWFWYNDTLPNQYNRQFYEFSSIQWKGQESEYRKSLPLLKLIDFSSNRLTGNIPRSLSSMTGLISLNLSRNSLTGNMIPDIGEMAMLECVDLSNNQLSGRIPTSLAKLQFLSVLDLSNNSFSGEIPTSTQLQSFHASAYSGNYGLCGPPLESCPVDSLRPPTTNPENERDDGLSFMQEVGISMGFGFIFGFWGFIGSLVLKKSWRIAFFNFFEVVGDWFYVKAAIFLSKLKQRPS